MPSCALRFLSASTRRYDFLVEHLGWIPLSPRAKRASLLIFSRLNHQVSSIPKCWKVACALASYGSSNELRANRLSTLVGVASIGGFLISRQVYLDDLQSSCTQMLDPNCHLGFVQPDTTTDATSALP